MELFKIGFLTVRLVDLLDVSAVTFLLYKLYQSLRGSMAIRVFGAIVAIFIIWQLVDLLEFRLLKSILDPVLSLGALSLVIIFTPEIRKFLSSISRDSLIIKLLRPASARSTDADAMEEIIEGIKSIRANGNGALIVLTGADPLTEIMETGDRLDAHITARLIYTIFQKESPLHDGAMILHQHKVAAVRCILPLSKVQLDPELGLRHRSAMGLAEATDAFVIVISEERKELSVVTRGRLRRNLEYPEVLDLMKRHYQRRLDS